MPSVSNIFRRTWTAIRGRIPPDKLRRVYRIIPLQLLASLLELFSLAMLLPVISIILDPKIIQINRWLSWFSHFTGITEPVSFVTLAFSIVVTVFILKNILLYFLYRSQARLTFGLCEDLSLAKYETYMNAAYAFHAENNSAVLMRNIIDTPLTFVSMVFLPYLQLINEVMLLALIIFSLLFYDPILFVSIICFSLPFLFFYNLFFRKRLRSVAEQKDVTSKQIYLLTLQSLASFREVLLFDKLGFFRPRFRNVMKSYGQSHETLSLLNNFSPKLIELVAVFCLYGVFIAGVLFHRDLASLAQFLIVFALAAYRIIPSVNKIILCTNYIKTGQYTLSYLDQYKKSEPQDNSSTGPMEFRKQVELRNISFSYNEAKGPVLRNVSLRIPKGKTVGIIGRSGEGKTTLLHLLLRLHEESSGSMLVDDTPLTSQNVKAWYKLASFVPQNIILLDGTIRENIAFGIPTEAVDKKALEKSIANAQLKAFIDELPQGLDTPIGENGIKISGGQRQRIGIARALYHGGELLIFDEATSSLDPETERSLTDDINRLSHTDYTIVLVTHRLQTLQGCDEIYEIKEGQLIGPMKFEAIAEKI